MTLRSLTDLFNQAVSRLHFGDCKAKGVLRRVGRWPLRAGLVVRRQQAATRGWKPSRWATRPTELAFGSTTLSVSSADLSADITLHRCLLGGMIKIIISRPRSRAFVPQRCRPIRATYQ